MTIAALSIATSAFGLGVFSGMMFLAWYLLPMDVEDDAGDDDVDKANVELARKVM